MQLERINETLGDTLYVWDADCPADAIAHAARPTLQASWIIVGKREIAHELRRAIRRGEFRRALGTRTVAEFIVTGVRRSVRAHALRNGRRNDREYCFTLRFPAT